MARFARLPVRGGSLRAGDRCPECRTRITADPTDKRRRRLQCSPECPRQIARINDRRRYTPNFHRELLPKEDRRCGVQEPKDQPPSFGEPVAGICVTIPGLRKPGCGGEERLDSTASLDFNGARACFRCSNCGRDRWVLIAPDQREDMSGMRHRHVGAYASRSLIPEHLQAFA